MRFHIHRDPNWTHDAVNDYFICCKCGARRVRRAYPLGHWGPVRNGWPSPSDRHGRPIIDTGWVKWPPA